VDDGGQTARQRDVDSIIEAARSLFAERGPAAVSLREVASRAGVNYGLIHRYIGSKEAMLRLVFSSSSESWTRDFSDADRPGDAIDLLLQPKTDTTYLRMLAHIILEGRDPAELLGSPPALRELVRRLDDEGDRLDDEGAASGMGSVDPRIKAAAITAAGMGWGLFGSHIRVIAGLGELPAEEVDQRIFDYLRQVFAGHQVAVAGE